MSLDVICAGLGRTGTLTFKKVLETLGYAPCWHMEDMLARDPDGREYISAWGDLASGKPVDWGWLFSAYRACSDAPVCFYYREILEAYPTAKVVLTLRDPGDWADSVRHLYAVEFLPNVEAAKRAGGAPAEWARSVQALFWDKLGDIDDRDSLLKFFDEHSREVRDSVPADKLLVLKVGEGGWQPFCEFLGKPVPTTAFPHANKRADMGQRHKS